MQELFGSENISQPFVIYLTVLFSLSLLCGVAYLINRSRRGLTHVLPEWDITWVDFLILVWLIFVWVFILSNRLSSLFHLDGLEYKEDWEAIINSCGMQLGMATVFLVYRSFRHGYRCPALSAVRMPFHMCIIKGGFFMLATYPLVTLVSILWVGILGELSSLGLDIAIEKQMVVQYFQDAPTTAIFASLSIIAVVVAPLCEEFIFRGAVYRFFKSKMGIHSAAFVSAALFAMLHFSVVGFPALMLLGYLLCMVYERTGNIWVGVCLHAFFNFNSVIMISMQPGL